jgi:hypothetical protein
MFLRSDNQPCRHQPELAGSIVGLWLLDSVGREIDIQFTQTGDETV